MKKYLLRYLVFWAPAALVSLFFTGPSVSSQILQWFFAFFLVFGWSANTGMFAYHYPRAAVSTLLIYTGINVFVIVGLYSSLYGSIPHFLLSRVGGLLSFGPLDVFVRALLDFNILHELYVLAFVVGCCLAGYLAGLLVRRVRPNPYRPRMVR